MRFWRRFVALVLVGALSGCGDESDDDDKDDEETSTESGGGDSGTTPTGVSPDAPIVTALSFADCTSGTDGQDIWILQATATDPQGDDTIDRGDAAIYRGETLVNSYPVICNNGVCSTSWEATPGSAGEVDCSFVGAGTLKLTVIDENGNRSAEFVVGL